MLPISMILRNRDRERERDTERERERDARMSCNGLWRGLWDGGPIRRYKD